MRKFTLAFLMIAILAVGMLAPALAGAHGDESTAGAADLYLKVDDTAPSVEIWQETNSDPGLQTSAHCHDANGADVSCDDDGAITVDPDTKIL